MAALLLTPIARRRTVGGPARTAARSAFFLTVGMLMSACGSAGSERQEPEENVQDIEKALALHTPTLMRIEGVQGVGQAMCDSTPCIRVYVLDAAAEARVPPKLDGIVVSTVVTGVIRGTNSLNTPPR